MGGLAGINVDVKDLGGIFSGVGTLAKDIRAAITGKSVLDPNKQAEIEAKLIELESAGMQGQNKVNEIEAASSSVFVAGWRPFIGWVCGASMAIYFIPMFTIGTYLWARQVISTGTWMAPPDLGIGQVISLVGAMLGVAILRTVEKKANVQGSH